MTGVFLGPNSPLLFSWVFKMSFKHPFYSKISTTASDSSTAPKGQDLLSLTRDNLRKPLVIGWSVGLQRLSMARHLALTLFFYTHT